MKNVFQKNYVSPTQAFALWRTYMNFIMYIYFLNSSFSMDMGVHKH